MSDIFPPRPLPRDDVAELAAAVVRPDFATQLLAYIRSAADIANFGTFYVADMSRPAPVLSIWAGEMSSYWFNRNASVILANDLLMQSILERIRAAQGGGLFIERWRPAPDDPISPIYARDQVIERVTVSSYSERVGFQSFFLRGKASGWLSDQDMQRLQQVLPLAHELIGLRHRIVGATSFNRTTGGQASALREQDAGPFGDLTPREAEVCDLAVRGMSVAGTALQLGVAENTIRTLRRRAYGKLGVHSAPQIPPLTPQAQG
ncbi:ATP-dependent transcriptional regulator [Phaeobacter sp. CECT 5382]|uniref:helix-turn-helix transcriptional regulator n=1 Tax=Phaeobacter sp. CECT 5382 TaxID=1712645 RepID=UPI0006DA4168|nr:helix-turn-helix transcriptional regulator [Phaeobacter sp. CECT 5382]CUH89905.1 ATP-dependent transcriptional regulator [Phaeobacter sp. CECT 5382]